MIETEHISKVRLNDFDPKKGLDRGAGKLVEMMWYLIKMLFFLNAFPFSTKFKVFVLRLFGARVGNGVVLKPKINIHMPWKLVIGNNVWIGEEVFILNFEQVIIGNSVCISQRAFLCGGSHDYKDPAMHYRNGPIELKDGVWICAGCFIGPNVTIGSDTVITAYSVVTGNIAANGIFKGNPALFVKHRWE